MSHEQLKDYVAQSLAQGMKPEEVRASLVSQGWSGGDIDQALGVPGASKPRVPDAADGRRKWPVVLAVFLVALLIGGVAFAGLKYFGTTPDKDLARAVNGAMAAASVEYAGSLRVEMTVDLEKEKGASTSQTLAMVGAGEPGEPTKLLLSFDGAYDRLDPAAPKSRGAYTLATTQALQGAPIGTLETRAVGGVTYVSLSKAPEIPFFDLSSLAGVWVKFDPKALTGMFGSASATSDAPKAAKEGPTEAQRNEIEKAFVELRPIYVAEKLKDEDVGGASSRHYRMAVDKEKLRAFALRTQEILGDKESLAYEKIADDYDKFSKDVEVTTFEIWIGKKDGLPTRLLLQASAKASDDVPGDGTFTLDATFRNFGKPIAIEAPADPKGIEEVFGMLMGGVAGGGDTDAVTDAQVRSDDTRRVSDIRQIQTALELGYAETNGYAEAGLETIGGPRARVLCQVDARSVWTSETDDCTGTIYMNDAPSDPALGSYLYMGMRSWYLLSFELEEGAGQLAAGPACATPNGIVSAACDEVDSDDDGFPDLDEIGNGYNPAGPGGLVP